VRTGDEKTAERQRAVSQADYSWYRTGLEADIQARVGIELLYGMDMPAGKKPARWGRLTQHRPSISRGA
jgi:hypothetical protein